MYPFSNDLNLLITTLECLKGNISLYLYLIKILIITYLMIHH